jgi:hypothetical protein
VSFSGVMVMHESIFAFNDQQTAMLSEARRSEASFRTAKYAMSPLH